MATPEQVALRERFEAVINAPENTDKRFEFIDGEVIEVPSNPYSSQLAVYIVAALFNFVDERDLGHVTTEQGGYVVDGWEFAPDAAFVSKARQHQLAKTGYNPIVPDLAVEVVSPSDTPGYIARKQQSYTNAGVTTWWFFPDVKLVEIHTPGKPLQTLGVDDMIDGGDILPGFQLPIKHIFRE